MRAPREGTMKKNQALKFLNPALGMLVLSQAITSSLHDFFPKELFEAVHGGGGILLVSGVALHVYLNWSWVRGPPILIKAGPSPLSRHVSANAVFLLSGWQGRSNTVRIL
jgi:hypothetical protein